jgi:ATP-dependent Clp protease ATP-binding subunit ClpA
MTSNLGATSNESVGFIGGESKYESALKEFFSPEFINRVDAKITFNPLDFEHIKAIAKIELAKLEKNLNKVTMDVSQKALEQIATLGYDKNYGARELQRVIDEHIVTPLTDEVLFGKLKGGGKVKIDYDKEFIFTYA